MSSLHFSLSIEKLTTAQAHDFIALHTALRARDEGKVRELLGAAFFKVVEAPFNQRSDIQICTLYCEHIVPKRAHKGTVKLVETSMMMMEGLNSLRNTKVPLWMASVRSEELLKAIEPEEFTITSGRYKDEWSVKLLYSCGDEAPLKLFVLLQAFFEAGWRVDSDLKFRRVEL